MITKVYFCPISSRNRACRMASVGERSEQSARAEARTGADRPSRASAVTRVSLAPEMASSPASKALVQL